MFCTIVAALVVGALLYYFVFRTKDEPLPMGDGWWGAGPRRGDDSKEIRPFKIETSDEELNDLFQRIDQTRYTEPLEGSRFNYGFNSTHLRKVVSYWRNKFDWKKQLEIINQYQHFKTKIEGLDIHYLHVKPKNLPAGRRAKPLIMVHGWPGSFYEFYRIIPLLTDPGSHSLSDENIFEVIIPSIPGYGFSEASHKQGCNSVAVARIFYKLMSRLGFREFYAQGGDWGALVCTNLAQLAPSDVKGVHLNLVLALFLYNPVVILSILLGPYFPRLFGFQDEDVRRMFPAMKKIVGFSLQESGYLHIQATKPDTAGCGLNNSPVALAAWILEKFSTWTDPDFRDHDDGGLERKYSLDDLLTNIMIYWLSGNVVSSLRFYKENIEHGIGGGAKHDKVPVKVPTGIASFPNELQHCPLLWAKQKFTNIVSYNYMPRGGHFAAFEEPEILAKDIQEFVSKVEKI